MLTQANFVITSTTSRLQRNYSHLVEVPKAHSLDGSRLPFRQGRHKLHGWRLLLHHSQRKGTQHGITLINKRLGSGAGIYRYHLTT